MSFASRHLDRRALSLGRAWYNASIDVTMADLHTCYYVNFPLRPGSSAATKE